MELQPPQMTPRLPRLGKIRLGIREAPNSNPEPSDHFIVPEKVAKVYGETPTELDIMFPNEYPNTFAARLLRKYTKTFGLVCIGDSHMCRRKVDSDGNFASGKDPKGWVWTELPCNPEECPEKINGRCVWVMNFMFVMPYVEGFGCWQIDTKAFNSWLNIYSHIRTLQDFWGRCSGVPMKLVLEPMEVVPQGKQKKTVYVLNIQYEGITPAEMAKWTQLPTSKALLPSGVTEEVPEDLEPYIYGEGQGKKPARASSPRKRADKQGSGQSRQKSENSSPIDVETGEITGEAGGESEKGAQEARDQLLELANSYDPELYTTYAHQWVQANFAPGNGQEVGLQSLTPDQVKAVRDWLSGAADREQKLVAVRALKARGYTTQDGQREIIEQTTGKERGWTVGDMLKVALVATRGELPASAQADFDPNDDEEAFLSQYE